MATQYDPIAKDESLNTTEATPRNIADVLAEELSGIASALTPAQLASLADVTISSPSDGQTLKYDSVTQKWVNANDAGGHTIENPSGTDMTQRANLQFVDAGVSDDSVNDRTKVEVVTELQSESDFDNLPTDGTADGVYCFPDSGAEYLTADNIGYGSDSVAEALNERPTMQKGSVTLTTSSTPFTNPAFGHGISSGIFNASASVTFDTPFDSIPTVAASVTGGYANAVYANMTIDSVSESGFRITYCSINANETLTFNWIALA